jgi:CubicO group peptidase (beta-lactamase class C family)
VGGDGMIVRYGYQVYTWGNPALKGDWGSASKAVLSTELFFADHEGLCTIHSDIGSFLSGGSPKDSSIEFFHLANMISGYSRAEWPGAAWAYNDYAINLYGYVLAYRVFGFAPQEVFEHRLGFLQLQDGYVINGTTQYGRIKQMSVRDFARIGLFWLNRGYWDGVQVLPASYFDTWVTNQVPPALPRTSGDGPESWNFGSNGGGDNQTRPLQGHYGMNFYVNTNGWWSGLPADIFQANGHDGRQVCTVIPGLRIVAVGLGSWGNPSTEAIDLLFQANTGTPVEAASWGDIKAGYRD